MDGEKINSRWRTGKGLSVGRERSHAVTPVHDSLAPARARRFADNLDIVAPPTRPLKPRLITPTTNQSAGAGGAAYRDSCYLTS